MNWCDVVVILIVGGFGIIGLYNGFIYSIFRIASFFVSAFVAVTFYPVVAKLFMKTAFFDNVKTAIFERLMQQAPKFGEQAGGAAVDAIVGQLPLPEFMRQSVAEKITVDVSQSDAFKSVAEAISSQIAGIAVNILSLVLLFIAVRIGMIFLRSILRTVAKLPVFKQMDKLGGFALGAVEGLLTIYILLAIVMIFQAAPQMGAIYQSIDQSVFARFFYQNNFLVNFVMG